MIMVLEERIKLQQRGYVGSIIAKVKADTKKN